MITSILVLFAALQMADISDASPQGIKDTLLVIGTLLGLAGGVLALIRKPQVIPQPMETRKSPDYVHRHEFNDLKAEIHTHRAEMQEMERRLSEQGEKRAVDIHSRIGPIAEAVAEIRGRLRPKSSS